MHLEAGPFHGVWSVELERHTDERGWFARSFDRDELRHAGVDLAVAQAGISFNERARTLRGIHLQRSPHAEVKLIRCTRGRLFDVAVDLRPASPTFGCWAGYELDEDGTSAVLIGEGLGHGFLTLEPRTEVSYLISCPYVPEAAAGVRWDDADVGIDWPASPELVSDRDRALGSLARYAASAASG